MTQARPAGQQGLLGPRQGSPGRRRQQLHREKDNAEGGPLTDRFGNTQKAMEAQQFPLLFCGLPNQPAGGPLIRNNRPPIGKGIGEMIGEELGQFTDPLSADVPPSGT